MSAVVGFERGWWYDVVWVDCPRCGGDGHRVECMDDLCHAHGRCFHDPANNRCTLCAGIGRISKELQQRWFSRDGFESVELPDADLWKRRDLHAVARERYEGGGGQ